MFRNKIFIIFILCILSLTGGLITVKAYSSYPENTNGNTYSVTRADDPSPNGCFPSDCSLREAIIAANNSPGHDTITIPYTSGTYDITRAGRDEDNAQTGDLDILGDLTIIGAGESESRIDGNNLDRVFDIDRGITVNISHLAIRDGRVDGDGAGIRVQIGATLNLDYTTIHYNMTEGNTDNGGGIYSENRTVSLTLNHVNVTSNDAGNTGGGIYSSGTLVIENSFVFANDANNGYGGGIYAGSLSTIFITGSTVLGNTADSGGGGISNFGQLVINNSAISGNNGGDGEGGGVENRADLTINNSTFYNNYAIRDGGGLWNGYSIANISITNSTFSANRTGDDGGGIFTNSPMTLLNVTVVNNQASDRGGGIGGSATVGNSIFANNLPTNCQNHATTQGHNLESANTCGFNGTGDIINTAPLLGPLQDNGGDTDTHALLNGSPAIDAGNTASCPGTDQRGVPRPQSAACDIGSYEVAQCYTLTTAISPNDSGAVSVDPQPNCSETEYYSNTSVTLTAVPIGDYSFVNWSGDINSDDETASIIIDEDKNVLANFAYCHSLTVVIDPSTAGFVEIEPSPNCHDQFVSGTMITLTAVANEGYRFSEWYGDVAGNINPTLFHLNDDRIVSADFDVIVPIILVSESGYQNVQLEWTVTNDPTVSAYRIWRKLAGTDDFSIIATTDETEYFDEDPVVIPGSEYCYEVEALRANGNSVLLSNQSCSTVGQLELWVPEIWATITGTVPIPINIKNAQNLEISEADMWLTYDCSVLGGDIYVESSPLTFGYEWTSTIVDNGSTCEVHVATSSATSFPSLYDEGAMFWVWMEVLGLEGENTSLNWIEYIQDIGGTFITNQNEPVTFIPLTLQNGFLTLDQNGAYRLGDVDGSGVVNTDDVTLALNISNGTYIPFPQQVYAGDINGDGFVTAADASMILFYIANGYWPSLENGIAHALRVNSASINVELNSTIAESNDFVAVILSASGLSEWAGGDFTIAFDPDLVIDVEEVSVAGIANEFEARFENTGDGLLFISMASDTPIIGDGPIAVITMQTGERPGATVLSLASVKLNDMYGRDFASSSLQSSINRTNGLLLIPSSTIYLPVVHTTGAQ